MSSPLEERLQRQLERRQRCISRYASHEDQPNVNQSAQETANTESNITDINHLVLSIQEQRQEKEKTGRVAHSDSFYLAEKQLAKVQIVVCRILIILTNQTNNKTEQKR